MIYENVFYKQRPLVVQAYRYILRDHKRNIDKWIKELGGNTERHNVFVTPNGLIELEDGDWLVRDNKGEFFRCGHGDFMTLYEQA